MHAHDQAQFTYASEGVLTVITPKGRYAIPPAMAVWIPPHVPHAVQTQGVVKFRSLYISPERLSGLPEDTVVLEVDPLLRALVLEVLNLPPDWTDEGPHGRLIQVLLDRIGNAPQARLNLPIPEDKRYCEVANALIANPSDRRSIPQLADEIGVTDRTFARRFKTETGLTFGEWRRRRVLLAALERLSAGESVTGIALDLGYDSPSAFIAMFKKALGAAPTRFIQDPSQPIATNHDEATNGPH